MKILVFTSKWIGLKFLDVLFSEFSEDEYIFIVSDPNSDKVIESIKKHGHQHMLLNDSTINWIKSKDEKYFDWLLNLWGSYIFSEDFCEGIYKIILKGVTGRTYHFSNESLYSVKSVINKTCKLMNVSYEKTVFLEKDRVGKDNIYKLACC